MQINFDLSPNNPNVLIFSDLHLYRHRNTYIFIDVVKEIFKKILLVVDKYNIKTIWFLGDWFHKKEKIGSEELSISSWFLKELEKRDIKILIIIGNHDFLYKSEEKKEINTVEIFKLSKNVYVINKYAFWEYKNKKYHFFSWTNWATKKSLLEKIDASKDNYLLGHLDLTRLKMNENFVYISSISDIDEEFLQQNFKISFLGHFHKTSKKDNIIVVGAPYQQSFKDQGNINGFFIYNVENDNIKFIQNDISPSFRKIYLSDLKISTKENIEKINIKDSFIRIILDKKIESDLLLELKEKLTEENLLVEIVFDYEDKEKDETNSLNGDLKQKLLVIDLNNSNNIKDFFRSYLEIFENLPEPLKKEKLIDIIENTII